MPGLEHGVLDARCALGGHAHDIGIGTDDDRPERREAHHPKAPACPEWVFRLHARV